MAARTMTKRDAEEILGMLGVGTYTEADLKRVYRELVRVSHPDVVAAKGGNVEAAGRRMSEINDAYNYLRPMFVDLGRETLTADGSEWAGAWETRQDQEPEKDPEDVRLENLVKEAERGARQAESDAFELWDRVQRRGTRSLEVYEASDAAGESAKAAEAAARACREAWEQGDRGKVLEAHAETMRHVEETKKHASDGWRAISEEEKQQKAEAEAEADATQQLASDLAEGPLPYRVMFTFFRRFPWRASLVVLALLAYAQITVGIPALIENPGALASVFPGVGEGSIAAEKPELQFIALGALCASLVNAATGMMTDDARKSCLWFVDALFGKAEPAPSARVMVFGHLPYRVSLLLFSLWSLETFLVESYGRIGSSMDAMLEYGATSFFGSIAYWLFFLFAVINMLIPFATDFIRMLLAGDEVAKYDESRESRYA